LTDVNATAAQAAQEGYRPRRRRVPYWALPWIGVVSVLALFELLSRSQLISSRNFPPVTEWTQALVDLIDDGDFWTAVGNTMQGWALGLGIAMAIAIPLGIVLGSSRLPYRALRAVIEFLRPIPSVALIPLAVLVWGTGLSSKVSWPPSPRPGRCSCRRSTASRTSTPWPPIPRDRSASAARSASRA
jgi:ABC-type phosphate/phosphonate transport system permease subunit